MRVKVLMRWDVKTGMESEYSEFIVNEFIPRAERLGLSDLQFWLTSYGDVEQIQASGVADSAVQMKRIMRSEEWVALESRLQSLVTRFSRKVIEANSAFQI